MVVVKSMNFLRELINARFIMLLENILCVKGPALRVRFIEDITTALPPPGFSKGFRD